VAGFKKFDPYAFLEKERRLATTNGTTQNWDGNLVKPNFSWFSTLAASAPGIEKGAGSSDLPSLHIDIQNQNSDAARAKVLKPLKVSNLIPTNVVDAFAVLERRCPDYIEPDLWRQAVDDGRPFLATWQDQATALGWIGADLFGLHEPPSNPHPSYNRLARYDCTGLVWLLRGFSVVAMTATTASIKTGTGIIIAYYRHNRSVIASMILFEDTKQIGKFGPC
jgi:hypothetical protein